MGLLLALNARSRKGLLYDLDDSGQISGAEAALRGTANDLFSALNAAGTGEEISAAAGERFRPRLAPGGVTALQSDSPRPLPSRSRSVAASNHPPPTTCAELSDVGAGPGPGGGITADVQGFNDDHQLDFGERDVSEVTVELQGTDDLGHGVDLADVHVREPEV